MDVIMIVVIILIFSISFFLIYKKDIIFSMVMVWMFAYCIFTIIGYLYFPRRLILHSGGQYYGMEEFYSYYLYILGFFIMVGLFYILINKIGVLFVIKSIEEEMKFSVFIYYFIVIAYLFSISFYLLKDYDALSYVNQAILKSNKIWFYAYTISGIFIVSLIDGVINMKKFKLRVFNTILLTGIVILTVWTSLKAGQRIELLMILNAVIAYFISSQKYNSEKNSVKNLKPTKIKFILVIVIFAMISQIIRSTRGEISKIWDLDFEMLLFNLFSIENLVFQDWLSPSLSLLSVIHYQLIVPLDVIKSNTLNIFSFIIGGYPSLGSTLSREIDPGGITGYGYYFLTEGYQLTGEIGFILSSFLLVFYYKFYQVFFISKNDIKYNNYMYGIIALFIIDLVRGQSLFFIKGILFYIIPAIILYFLQYGKLPRLYIKRNY